MVGNIDEPDDIKDPIDEDLSKDETSEDVSVEFTDLAAGNEIIDESTVEIEVEKLVAKLDSEDSEESAHNREIRRKIDALNEGGDDQFGSTYNFNLDDEL